DRHEGRRGAGEQDREAGGGHQSVEDAAHVDPECRCDAGPQAAGEAPPDDVHRVLTRREGEEDSGSDEQPIVMDTEHAALPPVCCGKFAITRPRRMLSYRGRSTPG